jgi:hypothetical protein
MPGLMKNTVFNLKKPCKNSFFFDFLDLSSGRPKFQKLVEQKLLGEYGNAFFKIKVSVKKSLKIFFSTGPQTLPTSTRF